LSFSQQPTQTVRGSVFDNETQFPLIGAKVIVSSDNFTAKALTDFEGEFVVETVPVGKHQVQVEYTLYAENTITIEVYSGKEALVSIPLVELITEQEEVVVKARRQGLVINEMALISAQQFSVEEQTGILDHEWTRQEWRQILQEFKGLMIPEMTLLFAETALLVWFGGLRELTFQTLRILQFPEAPVDRYLF
jgi:hypothetical protein